MHELLGERPDCGEPVGTTWLVEHAAVSVQAGVCAVYVLIGSTGVASRAVGQYVISPTQVVREQAPPSMARGWPRAVSARKLGKLAVHVDLPADTKAHRGRQLLRHALEAFVRIADKSGRKVIAVDADNEGLVGFYTRNGFTATGRMAISACS